MTVDRRRRTADPATMRVTALADPEAEPRGFALDPATMRGAALTDPVQG